jgi:hypothetical protein
MEIQLTSFFGFDRCQEKLPGRLQCVGGEESQGHRFGAVTTLSVSVRSPPCLKNQNFDVCSSEKLNSPTANWKITRELLSHGPPTEIASGPDAPQKMDAPWDVGGPGWAGRKILVKHSHEELQSYSGKKKQQNLANCMARAGTFARGPSRTGIAKLWQTFPTRA